MTTIYYSYTLSGTNNLTYLQINTSPISGVTEHNQPAGGTIVTTRTFYGIPNVAIIQLPDTCVGIASTLRRSIVTPNSGSFTSSNPLNVIITSNISSATGFFVDYDGADPDDFWYPTTTQNGSTLVNSYVVVGLDLQKSLYNGNDSSKNMPDTLLSNSGTNGSNTKFKYFAFPKNDSANLGGGYSAALKNCTSLTTLVLPSTFTSIDADCLNVTAQPNAANYPLTTIEVNGSISLGLNSLRGLKLTGDSIKNLRDNGNNDFAKLMVAGLTYQQVYDAITCFGENTKIMCCVDGEEKEVLVQNIRNGTLVKTLLHGYVPVHMIGTSKIHNLANNERYEERLYVCKKEKYPEVTEDLIITGCHSILVDNITDEQRANLMRVMKDIYVTDSKYRLIASLDERAEPYACEGIFNIYHFALENDSYYKNYGVFANGLLVESCSKRYLKELSNMTILE